GVIEVRNPSAPAAPVQEASAAPVKDASPAAPVQEAGKLVPQGVIDSNNADEALRPGDVLIKFAGTSSTWTEKVIEAGEKAVKKLSSLFHEGIKKGDPTCFHVAIYLGKGRTAEAHGGDLSTAR